MSHIDFTPQIILMIDITIIQCMEQYLLSYQDKIKVQ